MNSLTHLHDFGFKILWDVDDPGEDDDNDDVFTNSAIHWLSTGHGTILMRKTNGHEPLSSNGQNHEDGHAQHYVRHRVYEMWKGVIV